MSQDARLQQAAERRRREAGQRDELMALLTTHTGAEATTEVVDKFLADLTVETGALPELGRVVEAVKLANSIEAPKVGNAVRQLFRRGRTRPPGAPAARPGGPPPQRTAPPPQAPAPAAPTPAPAPEAPAPAPVAEAPEAPVAEAPEAPAEAAPTASPTPS
jgi:hypothetical protein